MSERKSRFFYARSSLLLLVVLTFGYAAWASTGFAPTSRQMPMGFAILGALLAAIALARTVRTHLAGRRHSHSALEAVDQEPAVVGRQLLWFGVIAAYIVTIMILGYLIATAIFIGLVLFLMDRSPWWVVALSVSGVLAAVMFWERAYGIMLP